MYGLYDAKISFEYIKTSLRHLRCMLSRLSSTSLQNNTNIVYVVYMTVKTCCNIKSYEMLPSKASISPRILLLSRISVLRAFPSYFVTSLFFKLYQTPSKASKAYASTIKNTFKCKTFEYLLIKKRMCEGGEEGNV